MRPLHVCEAWRPVTTGNTTRSYERIAAQRRAGITLGVVVTSRQFSYREAAAEAAEGLTQLKPNQRERLARKLRPFYLDPAPLRRAIVDAAKRSDATVIHAHWSDAIGHAAALAARDLNLPFVAEVRFDLAGGVFSEGLLRLTGLGPVGGERLLRRRVERHLKHADHVVAASHTLGDLVRQSFPFTADRLTVIPNGLDAGRFSPGPPPGELVERLGLAGRFVVGTTGTMYRYEGLDALFRSAATLRRDLPDLRLLFVGGGPRRAALERLAAKLDVPAVFHGPVGRGEMPDVYRLFDVFAVPRRRTSITRYAAPIKLTEAMAAGRACLGTAVGDVPMLLADGRGTVVPPGDDAALVEAIRRLATDADCRRATADAAHAWATATLNWDEAADADARIYAGIAR